MWEGQVCGFLRRDWLGAWEGGQKESRDAEGRHGGLVPGSDGSGVGGGVEKAGLAADTLLSRRTLCSLACRVPPTQGGMERGVCCGSAGAFLSAGGLQRGVAGPPEPLPGSPWTTESPTGWKWADSQESTAGPD